MANGEETIRIHVPFSLTNLAQWRQELSQFSEDPSKFVEGFHAPTPVFDLSWKDAQVILSTYCTPEEEQNLDSSPGARWPACWRPTQTLYYRWRCSPKPGAPLESQFLGGNRSQEAHEPMCIRRDDKVLSKSQFTMKSLKEWPKKKKKTQPPFMGSLWSHLGNVYQHRSLHFCRSILSGKTLY